MITKKKNEPRLSMPQKIPPKTAIVSTVQLVKKNCHHASSYLPPGLFLNLSRKAAHTWTQGEKKETMEVGRRCMTYIIPAGFSGLAQVFISHAWSQPFTRITDLLLKGINSRYKSNVYVWFDLLVCLQNGGPKQTDDLNSINSVIRSWSETVLRLDQRRGDDLPVMLTRMWCL